jgi:hypothetical protein
MASPTIKLNSGYEMPQVGFGLWKVANETAADTVYEAIKAGYRLFDGACGTCCKQTSPCCLPFAPPTGALQPKPHQQIDLEYSSDEPCPMACSARETLAG